MYALCYICLASRWPIKQVERIRFIKHLNAQLRSIIPYVNINLEAQIGFKP